LGAGEHDLYQIESSLGGAGHVFILCLEGADIVLVQAQLWIA